MHQPRDLTPPRHSRGITFGEMDVNGDGVIDREVAQKSKIHTEGQL